ncbi:MAG: YaaL family protein [Lachnospiraceae bacterium]|nr:YaaL family protein [Lachnospiraceae bacterium]
MLSLFKKEKEETNFNPLISELESTKNDLCAAYSNFENAIDPDLVDSCIYELQAIQLRYKFLLTKIREMDSTN